MAMTRTREAGFRSGWQRMAADRCGRLWTLAWTTRTFFPFGYLQEFLTTNLVDNDEFGPLQFAAERSGPLRINIRAKWEAVTPKDFIPAIETSVVINESEDSDVEALGFPRHTVPCGTCGYARSEKSLWHLYPKSRTPLLTTFTRAENTDEESAKRPRQAAAECDI